MPPLLKLITGASGSFRLLLYVTARGGGRNFWLWVGGGGMILFTQPCHFLLTTIVPHDSEWSGQRPSHREGFFSTKLIVITRIDEAMDRLGIREMNV